MRLSRLGLSIGGSSSRRTTRIVIPSLDNNSTISADLSSGGKSTFNRGGAMHSQRFATADNNKGHKKLYEDSAYVSERQRDRWTGQGPTRLQKGRNSALLSKQRDFNDHSNTFNKVSGSPSSQHTGPGEEVAKILGGAEADFVRRRKEQHRFVNAVDEQHEQVWRDSKAHIRQQERSMSRHGGIEGAIADRLAPADRSTSRNELKNRKLDKRILEEVYKDLHGKRSEQALKKNVHWERWTAKTNSNAPVMSASRMAQETFGFGGTAQLVKSATTREQFPITPLPEIAFLGRTNSGRSSLINAVLNSYVCRFGHMKGTTKTADFVNVANKLMLVDLPGYGHFHPFASDPLRVKQSQTINEAYIAACALNGSQKAKERMRGPVSGERDDGRAALQSGRQRNLKRIFICVPCVTGLHDGDLTLCDMLQERNIPFSVLLTKTDLVSIRSLARVADLTRERLTKYTSCEELLMVNSLRLAGITKIQNLLGNVARKEDLAVDPLEMTFDTIM